jgi:hypothetical protein
VNSTDSAVANVSDAALDRVTAGVSTGMSDGVVKFQGSVPTANGLVTGAGTLAVLTGPITGTNMSTLTLNCGAQQNLSSLVNINAVDSNINVLLNPQLWRRADAGHFQSSVFGGLPFPSVALGT